EGFATEVGEGGSTLSAGQRQRVALARALVRDAPILILDEATANVDVETEWQILNGLFAWRRDLTVLFATHRLQSAAQAQRIAVLEAGRLAGVGPHQELVATCEPYRRMQDIAFGRPEGALAQKTPQPTGVGASGVGA
ncbi:MAG: ABC transporter ATP-binding protein, partial [Acidobacteriota bacterium]